MTVTWQSLHSAVIATDALLAGQLDLICGTITSLLVLWDKTNGRAKVLAGLAGQLVTLVTRNPLVKTVGDFGPDDRIAVPSVKQGPHSILLGIALDKQLGAGAYNRLDSIQVQMGHNDGALAVLTPSSPVNSHFSTLPYMAMERASKNPVVRKVTDLLDPIGVSRDYIAATGEKFEPAALAEMIGRGGNLYATAPLRTDVYAAQMFKTGLIKKAPASWKDYHFPLLHDRQGS